MVIYIYITDIKVNLKLTPDKYWSRKLERVKIYSRFKRTNEGINYS